MRRPAARLKPCPDTTLFLKTNCRHKRSLLSTVSCTQRFVHCCWIAASPVKTRSFAAPWRSTSLLGTSSIGEDAARQQWILDAGKSSYVVGVNELGMGGCLPKSETAISNVRPPLKDYSAGLPRAAATILLWVSEDFWMASKVGEKISSVVYTCGVSVLQVSSGTKAVLGGL